MYKNAVLDDILMLKCNYCVGSVIDVVKSMILKFDIYSFAQRLVKLFRNRLLCQFLLNCLGSAF
ncbi:hypothetical protein TSAR_013954 [Trichomalopsis sarcophagae]|uniref:Uncharacterized protein n=1 Tax=Trichomalopsis sarcophagae TaxID=543379 RepID=A0A232FCI1_9HYME|nr:hypothetical protein TSAR_013954 [Trichomalopsis sarcophagae]